MDGAFSRVGDVAPLLFNPASPPLITPLSPSYLKRGKMEGGVRLGGREGLWGDIGGDIHLRDEE
jgi:hypothetical protein